MSFKAQILDQFRQPHGMLGRLAGFIMANRPSNKQRNRWTLQLLQLNNADRVLEVGFGPGFALQLAYEIAPRAFIVGVDHSATMAAQAKKRLGAEALQRVQLYTGTTAQLPAFEHAFTKIYSSNVVQFWAQPLREYEKLFSLLAPGGTIATTFMPRHAHAQSKDAIKMADKIEGYLRQTGYVRIRTETLPLEPVAAVCVLAQKPAFEQ